MPYPSLLHTEPRSLWQSTADLYLHRTCSNTILSQSLWGPWGLVHTRFVWALWVSLAGMGFDSKQWKQWLTLFFGAPKLLKMVTASHEIKRPSLFGRKVMTNLDSIIKSRDITLPTRVCLVKAMVFPVFMCGCESWTIKKAESGRIDAFELWC